MFYNNGKKYFDRGCTSAAIIRRRFVEKFIFLILIFTPFCQIMLLIYVLSQNSQYIAKIIRLVLNWNTTTVENVKKVLGLLLNVICTKIGSVSGANFVNFFNYFFSIIAHNVAIGHYLFYNSGGF